MDFLPSELLIAIFSHLPPHDLLTLTLTTSKFNDMISTTSELTSTLTIFFKTNQDDKTEEILATRRKFRTLIIENFTPLPHLKVLNFIAPHIRTIEIRRWNWSLDCRLLYQLFSSLPNVKHVKFRKILFHFGAQFSESVKTIGQLESLEVLESDSQVFRLFMRTQVRKLVYDYVPSGGNFPIPDMIRFLRRQERLEELTLKGFLAFFNAGIGRIIFDGEKLSRVKFRLTKLSIIDCPITHTVHFKDFLQLHVNSIRFLQLDNVENWNCANFIDSCERLEVLKINKRHKTFSFDKISTNKSVTVLEVNGPVDKNFLNKFPNLKILKVASLRTDRGQFDEELACNQIEVMRIEKSYLGGFFKFPMLRKLHLKNIRVMSEKIFDVNPWIREVTFESCDGEMVEKIRDGNNKRLRVTVI
jgi:hypothetical protein